jgi:hypothetical protein
MALHVIDANEWELASPSRGFGKRMSDEKRSHQTGTSCGGNTVEIIWVNAGIREGLVSQRPNRLDVGPGGHLRHDSSEPRMQLDLRGEDVGEWFVATNHCDGRLITTGLKREDRRIHLSRSAYSAESMS